LRLRRNRRPVHGKPRLKLLRDFLTDDGVIFVSIDDNEVHWFRGRMDEVFGEENLVAQFIWRKMARQINLDSAVGTAKYANHAKSEQNGEKDGFPNGRTSFSVQLVLRSRIWRGSRFQLPNLGLKDEG